MKLARTTASFEPGDAGLPLGAAAGGERRQVTALFYDIVGSTELLNQLDPEELGLLLQDTHDAASAAIERNGGSLDQVMGDGGYAYFGYPISAEDAAESAVTAALELLERYQPHAGSRERGLAPRIRIGIATGLVVINQRGSVWNPSQNSLVGLAPTLAARLQSIAEPNTVAVSNQTYRLTRWAFKYQNLGAIQIKGFEQPHHIWRPLEKHALSDRFSRTQRSQTPLVGREAELACILGCWRSAKSGKGHLVELVGEPGIGKSRLTSELRRELSNEGAAVRIFQCQPRGNTRPLHPFIDGVRLATQSGNDSPDEDVRGTRRKGGYLDRILADCSRQTRAMVSFLLAEDKQKLTRDSSYVALSGDEFRKQALDAALEVIEGWCREGPQILIIEDLHWMDTLTAALIERLAVEVEHLPMLLIVTSRNLPSPSSTGAQKVTILLHRLTTIMVADIVSAAWHPNPVLEGLAAFIADKSDGVPLFVEELAAFLNERTGSIKGDPAVWARALQDNAIATLDDLLAARLASLGDARKLAQTASVIGREFSLDLLSRLAEAVNPGLSIESDLATLLQARLVHRINVTDRPVFRFQHVLVQEAAYSSLLKSQRRQLHSVIVDLMLNSTTMTLTDDVMAWHCEQARRGLLAVKYAISAGEASAIRSAPREAARMFELAGRCLEYCEPGADTDDLMLRLLVAHGPVAVALFGKGSPEARAIYDKGVAICRERTVEDREKWFPLYWGWWFTSPNGVVKRKRSEVIIRDLATANQAEIRLQAFHCAWAANFHAANHAVCLHAIEQGLLLYDHDRARESRLKFGGHDTKVCGLGERAQLHWLCGNPDAAEEAIKAAVEWAEGIDHIGSISHGLENAILLRSYQRQFEEVASLADRLRVIAEKHSLTGIKAKSKVFAGWACAMTGSLERGLAEFKQGLTLHSSIGTDEDLPIYSQMHAELLERAGRFEEAKQALDMSISLARATSNLFWLPELARRRALIGRATGENPIVCQTDMLQALALAEHQGATALADRARADLEQFDREPHAYLAL